MAAEGKNATKPHTIDDALAQWLSGEARLLKSAPSVARMVSLISRNTYGRPLTDLVDVAQEIKREGIQAGLRAATINRRLAILRRVANLAHDEWGWLDSAIGRRITLIPGEAARDVYLSVAEAEKLAEACDDSRAAIAVRLAVRTGLRETEILSAETIVQGCLVIASRTAKNSRPRRVPIPPDMQDLVVPLGISYAQLRRSFEAARIAAGLPHVRFHDLRHTAASWWIASGASLPVVRDLLGHSNLSVTSRYLHLMTGDLLRGAEAVAAFIAHGTQTAQDDASD